MHVTEVTEQSWTCKLLHNIK